MANRIKCRDEMRFACLMEWMVWSIVDGGARGLAGKINFHICDFTYVMLIQIGLERARTVYTLGSGQRRRGRALYQAWMCSGCVLSVF